MRSALGLTYCVVQQYLFRLNKLRKQQIHEFRWSALIHWFIPKNTPKGQSWAEELGAESKSPM